MTGGKRYRSVRRRRFTPAVAVLIVAMAALPGCGGSGGSDNSSNVPATKAEVSTTYTNNTTLNVRMWDDQDLVEPVTPGKKTVPAHTIVGATEDYAPPASETTVNITKHWESVDQDSSGNPLFSGSTTIAAQIAGGKQENVLTTLDYDVATRQYTFSCSADAHPH